MSSPAERPTAVGRPIRPPAPSLLGALLGGLGVSAGIITANHLAERLGLTELDLPRILGLTFRNPEQDGVKATGLLWYFAWGGVAVPTLYWLGFSALRRTGPRAGLAIGVGHYLLSGALLGASDPSRPKQSDGSGRPMGPFVSRYGRFEWCANLAGHIAYALVIGRAASHRPSPS